MADEKEEYKQVNLDVSDEQSEKGADEEIWDQFEKEDAEGVEGATEATAEVTDPENSKSDAAAAADGQEEKSDVPDGAADDGTGAASDASEPKKSSGDEEPDIWAAATPEQKAAYEEAKRLLSAEAGRVSSLQRRVNDLLQTQVTPTGRTGGKQVDAKAALDPLKKMAEDYPEFANSLEAMVKPLVDKIEQLEGDNQRRSDAAQNYTRETVRSETERLNQLVPGWNGFVRQNVQDLGAWVQDQPLMVRQAFERNRAQVTNADEVVAVLRLYSEDRGFTQPAAAQSESTPPPQGQNGAVQEQTQRLDEDRQRQLEGMRAPPPKGSRPVTSGIPESGDPEAIWEAFEREDELRAQRGR